MMEWALTQASNSPPFPIQGSANIILTAVNAIFTRLNEILSVALRGTSISGEMKALGSSSNELEIENVVNTLGQSTFNPSLNGVGHCKEWKKNNSKHIKMRASGVVLDAPLASPTSPSLFVCHAPSLIGP